jgi:hypothetical protein
MVSKAIQSSGSKVIAHQLAKLLGAMSSISTVGMLFDAPRAYSTST